MKYVVSLFVALLLMPATMAFELGPMYTINWHGKMSWYHERYVDVLKEEFNGTDYRVEVWAGSKTECHDIKDGVECEFLGWSNAGWTRKRAWMSWEYTHFNNGTKYYFGHKKIFLNGINDFDGEAELRYLIRHEMCHVEELETGEKLWCSVDDELEQYDYEAANIQRSRIPVEPFWEQMASEQLRMSPSWQTWQEQMQQHQMSMRPEELMEE